MPLRPKMELREYGKLFLRRKWQVVFTVLFILFTASVYCVVTPELYKSSITILVIPQPVPAGFRTFRGRPAGRTAVGHDQAAGDEPHDVDEGDGRASPLREGEEEKDLRGTVRKNAQADRDRGRSRAKPGTQRGVLPLLPLRESEGGDERRDPAGFALHRREPDDAGTSVGGYLRIPRVPAQGYEGKARGDGTKDQGLQNPAHGGTAPANGGEPAHAGRSPGPAPDQRNQHPHRGGAQGLSRSADQPDRKFALQPRRPGAGDRARRFPWIRSRPSGSNWRRRRRNWRI